MYFPTAIETSKVQISPPQIIKLKKVIYQPYQKITIGFAQFIKLMVSFLLQHPEIQIKYLVFSFKSLRLNFVNFLSINKELCQFGYLVWNANEVLTFKLSPWNIYFATNFWYLPFRKHLMEKARRRWYLFHHKLWTMPFCVVLER